MLRYQIVTQAVRDHIPHANDKLCFTYLLAALVGLLSGPQWACPLICRYHIVEVFQFSHLRDPEVHKFQNLVGSSLSTDNVGDEIFAKIC